MQFDFNKNESLSKKITITDLNSETISKHLDKFGCCIIPNFVDPNVCDRIRKKCIERAEVEKDINFSDGSYRRYDIYQGTGAASNKRVYHVDCFDEEAMQFKTNELFAKICSNFYGGKDDYSVHVQVYERHQYHPIPVRGFHIDTFELSTFKIFLYLSDVNLEDGPTSYILYTHNDAELRRMKKEVWGPVRSMGFKKEIDPHPTNFLPNELGEERLKNWVRVLGGKGTVFLFDTWGIHCGADVEQNGDRHVLINYYRKGKNLPRSDFGFDAASDYKKYAGRDFKK